MSVLVTGATGFVGQHLLRELRRRDPEQPLWGLARNEAALRRMDPSLKIRPLPGDVTHAPSLREAILYAAPRKVYHLAGHATLSGDPLQMRQTNVEGMNLLLDALAALDRPARVLAVSTGYVYGQCDAGTRAREDDPLAPGGPYAESKAEMERVALAARRLQGVSVVVARAFNHTGPGQEPRYVVSHLARQVAAVAAGRAPGVQAGNLWVHRDFLDVRDVVKAYRLLMECEQVGVVNVCSGTAVCLQDLFQTLCRLAEVAVEPQVEECRVRAGEANTLVGNPERLRKWTGWRPSLSLEQTLRETLAWWRAADA